MSDSAIARRFQKEGTALHLKRGIEPAAVRSLIGLIVLPLTAWFNRKEIDL